MSGRTLLTLNLIEKDTLSLAHEDDDDCGISQWPAFDSDSSPFNEGPFADPMARGRPRRWCWLVGSAMVQALVLGTWTLHSLTTHEEPPPPRFVQTFFSLPPVTAEPPPRTSPPGAEHSAPSRRAEGAIAAPMSPMRLASLTSLTPAFVALDIEDTPGAPFDSGGDGGVPGGVVGGLVGGLVPNVVEAPRSSRASPAVYEVSGELAPPNKLVHVDPTYPAIASAAGVEGVVVLEAVIDGEGNVDALRVLHSIPLLDEAALEAVKQWKYEPTIVAGVAVTIQMMVTVRFSLA